MRKPGSLVKPRCSRRSQRLVVARLDIRIDADGESAPNVNAFVCNGNQIYSPSAALYLNYLSLASRKADPRCLMSECHLNDMSHEMNTSSRVTQDDMHLHTLAFREGCAFAATVPALALLVQL
jgi:hypothetical protein